jgi:hypothetical protein
MQNLIRKSSTCIDAQMPLNWSCFNIIYEIADKSPQWDNLKSNMTMSAAVLTLWK